MIRLITLQILALSLILSAAISLYPEIVKVRVAKPKKSKTQEQKERQTKEEETDKEHPCEKEMRVCKLGNI